MSGKKTNGAQAIIQKKIALAKDFNEASQPYQFDLKLRSRTNCYSYALGIPEHHHAVPGYLTAPHLVKSTEKYAKKITSKFIFDQLVKDGLMPITEAGVKKDSPVNIIAAFIAPHEDFHFYRYHQDGTWSHQKGYQGTLSIFDNNHDRIDDIFCADHEKFKEFVGFFALPEEGIKFYLPKSERYKPW